MLGKLGNMIKKLQDMKQMSAEANKMLEEMLIEYTSPDGKFHCTMNGNRILKKISFHPSVFSVPHENIEQQLLEYLNEAYVKAKTETEKELMKMAKDIFPEFPE